MQSIYIRDEYIKLGQAMKLAGLVGSGVEAKELINGGEVLLNGRVELKRGKKCVPGDKITFQNEEVMIERK
ncbi:MAG: RNA-binding S4 domain-containing protein [Lachnospiraceae bacterium]|nr:RNA-binding S4 domain-containing protein [Lachnospiraceae bacterium]